MPRYGVDLNAPLNSNVNYSVPAVLTNNSFPINMDPINGSIPINDKIERIINQTELMKNFTFDNEARQALKDYYFDLFTNFDTYSPERRALITKDVDYILNFKLPSNTTSRFTQPYSSKTTILQNANMSTSSDYTI